LDPVPPRAGFRIRAAAAAIDAAVALLIAIALSRTIGWYFAERAVVTLHIGQPGTLWKGPIPMILGAFGEVVYGLPFAGLLAWSADPLTGATLGKRLFRLRVRAVDGGPARTSRRLLRFAIQTVGLWGWTLALLSGRWEMALAATVTGVAVLLGAPLALGPRSLALHDRLSRTALFRIRRAVTKTAAR